MKTLKQYALIALAVLMLSIPALADECTGNTFVGQTVDQQSVGVASNIIVDFADYYGQYGTVNLTTDRQGNYSFNQPYCGWVTIRPIKIKNWHLGDFQPYSLTHFITGPHYQADQFVFVNY